MSNDKFKEQQEIQKQIDKLSQEISYDTRDYPISWMVNEFDAKDEDDIGNIFAPDYQRKAGLWSLETKSKFIESLILGYPIPMIFLADNKNGKLEIIDGLQRISTLSEFFNFANHEEGGFCLKGLSKLDKLNKKQYKDLPESEQRRLKNKSLRVIVLEQETDKESRKELFDRINTTGVNLTSQETRSAREVDNPFMQFIKEDLAQNEIFKNNTKLSNDKINRQDDLELISRFFALSYNLDKYKNSLKNFVDEFIQSNQELKGKKQKQYEKDFIQVMEFVAKYFPNGFRLVKPPKFSVMVFDSIAVGVYLAIKENPNLKVNKEKVAKMLSSKDYLDLIPSGASNNKNPLLKRINFVKDFLLQNAE
jgi:hypothetical protein